MRHVNRPSIAGLFVLLSLCLTTQGAAAATIEFDLNGIESVGERGDSANTLLTLDLNFAGTQGPVEVSAIGWDVIIETLGNSWLSEATIGFEDSAGNALLDLRPGIDDTFAGTQSYLSDGNALGQIPLGDLAFVLDDGLLILNFHETFDDVAGMTDAIWNGSLSFQASPVPVPAAGLLLLSALGALGLKSGATRSRT
ncbi:MAG: hypothetical protein AB8G16_12790 [Gammaproteobacteria bacterium]